MYARRRARVDFKPFREFALRHRAGSSFQGEDGTVYVIVKHPSNALDVIKFPGMSWSSGAPEIVGCNPHDLTVKVVPVVAKFDTYIFRT